MVLRRKQEGTNTEKTNGEIAKGTLADQHMFVGDVSCS